MRANRFLTSSVPALAALVFWGLGFLAGVAPSPCDAQDRPLLRLLLGDRDASARERGRGRSLFGGGPKRVEINLTEQTLRAYEGRRLVMQSRISSGRGRITPTGSFTAGPYMAENHYSSLFNNAHMPWSVQVQGNIFIHGFAEVPDYPASKGCIRLPISGNNPARRFYQWVEVGTPIRIFY